MLNPFDVSIIQPSGEVNLGGVDTQNKFLGGLLPSSSIYLYTTTTTVVSTVVSTLTTPSTFKCIPPSQFSATANVTSCARRRREIESPIEPNQPLAYVLYLYPNIFFSFNK